MGSLSRSSLRATSSSPERSRQPLSFRGVLCLGLEVAERRGDSRTCARTLLLDPSCPAGHGLIMGDLGTSQLGLRAGLLACPADDGVTTLIRSPAGIPQASATSRNAGLCLQIFRCMLGLRSGFIGRA